MERKYRLRKRREFNYIYRKGKSLANPCLVLVYRRNNKNITRVGFSVSKKFGNAVKRNKIKRRLKEIYRKQIPFIRSGSDLIFIVRIGAREASFKELNKWLKNLLYRAGLLERGANQK